MRFSHENEGRDKTGITQWLSAVHQSNLPPPDTMDSFAEEGRMPDGNSQQSRINEHGKGTSGAGMQWQPCLPGKSHNEDPRVREETSTESHRLFGLPPSCSPVHQDAKSRIPPSKVADQPFSLNPADNYDRKPRHKTRKNRYEPIVGGNSPHQLASSTKRKKQATNSKRAQHKVKRKRLDDDFRASNAREGRLTVSLQGLPLLPWTYKHRLLIYPLHQPDPNFEMGLFRHGKTSSPVRRSGSELPLLPCSQTLS